MIPSFSIRRAGLVILIAFSALGAGCVLPWRRPVATTLPDAGAATLVQTTTSTVIDSAPQFVTLLGVMHPGVTSTLTLTIDPQKKEGYTVDGFYTEVSTGESGWVLGNGTVTGTDFSLFLNSDQAGEHGLNVRGTWSTDRQQFISSIAQIADDTASTGTSQQVVWTRVTTQPVSFALHTEQDRWLPNEDEGCLFHALYPEILPSAGVSEDVRQKMNQVIMEEIGLSVTTTLAEQREIFMNGCKQELSDLKKERASYEEMGPQMRSYDQGVRLAYNAGHLVSLAVGISSYTGGAHGAWYGTGLTMDTRTGKVLKFGDLVAPEKLRFFKQQVNQRLLKNYHDDLFEEVAKEIQHQIDHPNASSSTVALQGFAEASNFHLTPAGLNIFYQQYEVAPYAVGVPELFFTNKELDAYGFTERLR